MSYDSADSTTAFHAGESALQERLGVRDKLARVGQQVIRDRMSDQHRDFFAQLPFVVLGAVDAQGQPWASVLANPPGFISTPDEATMHIDAAALPQDPLHMALAPGAAIGLLGIEPHTRRRNRMNGVIERIDPQRMSVHVSQSFGNCPKYIQAREPSYAGPAGKALPVAHPATALDAVARGIIEQADTFFIASAHPQANVAPTASNGVDVSHRGGKPGFVRIDDANTLTAPDFTGNFFFNTLGNLALNPRAGLLFIDFENGDLLYLAASAEILWDGDELSGFAGAERLLRFSVQQAIRVSGAMPLRWGSAEPSPYLARTGAWK